MSDVALPTITRGAWRRFVHGCRQFLIGLAEGFAATRCYRRTSSLSDGELRRLGVARRGLAWFAVHGGPRR